MFNVILIIITISALILFFRSKNSTSSSNQMLEEILLEGFKHSSLSEASNNIMNIIRKHYNANYVTIYITNNRGLYTIASNVDSGFINKLEEHSNELLKSMDNLKSKKKISKGGSLTYQTARERNINFSSFTPLHWNNKLIGAILIENRSVGKMNKKSNRIKLYDNIVKNITLILQNVMHYDGVISDLLTDDMTGVYNRRFINNTLPEQIKRHENLKLPFVITILDIDHFKKFNDTYGHQFGDTTLIQVSNFIKSRLRENDWIARYGGEEFIIFLSKTDKEKGYKIIDNIRENLSKLMITDGITKTNVTASFGITELEDNINLEDLIQRADKALYVAKESGRNKVVIYEEDMSSIKLNK